MPQSQGLSSSTTTITSVKHNKKYKKEKSLKTHNKQMKSDTSVRLEDIPSRSRYGDTDVAADAPRPRSSLTPADYVDYQIKQNIERYKKQIIVHLMDQGLECLDNQLKMYEGLCTEDLTGTCGPSPQSPFNISNVGNRAIAKLAGQKRQLQKDDTDEEKDTEAADGAKRSKISKRTKTGMNLKPFACPYFKFDPERFGKHRTCCGPGFTDLNRLKEHLKRQHRCFECSRCFELFYKEEKLERHQRQSKPCAVKERINAIRDYGDGYDQTQEKELKKRLKANDKDKWAAWYRVLFCVDATSLEVPSPYFENPESRAPSSKSRACGKHRAFFDYVRRELPHLMLDLITEEVDRLMAGIEGKARQSIQPKLPDLTFKLQRLFQNIPPLSVQGEEADAGDDSEPGSSAPEHFNLDLFQDFELIPPDCFDLPGSGYLNTEPSDYSSMLSATDTSSVPLLSSTSDSSFDTTDAGAFGGSRLHDPPRPYYSS